MAYDFRAQRLFVDFPLDAGAIIEPDRAQAHYLLHVLRLKAGDAILVFNGRDGEWRAILRDAGRKTCRLAIDERSRAQPDPPDLDFLFAPLKQARLDYMVQKAVEMGAGRLVPVKTQFTQISRVNADRMRANAIEAAEQCGILSLPEIAPLTRLDQALAGWDPARRLIFCDEAAPVADPLAALRAVPAGPLAVLIGPEGGFSADERARLMQLPQVTAISLGPRILRADTAAVAALAIVQAVIGKGR
ncbi:MAG: 16S rRNA (uracil(1498)-N(3))-methyltransferase [Hyphomicrobiales bacterium]|nr:16S rRNA (uracil(1498)-N(3))-methyltransferase [Hyphomicrobiales bacterium]